MNVIARGAEATISEDVWNDRRVIIKDRVPKRYRVPELDAALRASRTKSEAFLMVQARHTGVRTPIIFDIDLVNCRMVMEFIEGPTAKTVLQDSEDRMNVAREIGRCVARLHREGIIHGDLTTSNIIVTPSGPGFIDFGLGEKSQELEKKGVDLHLMKEALESAHSDHMGLYDELAKAYLEVFPEGEAVVKLVKQIDKRGRYT